MRTIPNTSEKPLFASPIINRAFVLKHRTRADESYLFASPARGGDQDHHSLRL